MREKEILPRAFRINLALLLFPVSLNTTGLSILSLPHKDMRFYGFNRADFLKNIVFFVLFGTLLSAIILKKFATGYLATFLIVTLTGGAAKLCD